MDGSDANSVLRIAFANAACALHRSSSIDFVPRFWRCSVGAKSGMAGSAEGYQLVQWMRAGKREEWYVIDTI